MEPAAKRVLDGCKQVGAQILADQASRVSRVSCSNLLEAALFGGAAERAGSRREHA